MLATVIQKKKSRKAVILEEAAALIHEKGYVAATMRDIATRVGVEAASLYNHIKSKQQILHEICFGLADRYMQEMEQIEQSGLSYVEKIKSLVDLHITVNAEQATLSAVMNDEWRHLKEPDLSRFVTLRNGYENKFIDIIDQGVKNGEIKAVDPKIALYTILGAVRWLQHWYTPGKPPGLERVRQNIVGIVMGGIEKNEST